MTIAVAVRNYSSIVFAVDSRISTGSATHEALHPYDNAIKVVHDLNRRVMVLVTGRSNFGLVGIAEFIASWSFPECADTDTENSEITRLLDALNAVKTELFSKAGCPESTWHGPVLLLAASPNKGRTPSVWETDMAGRTYSAPAAILTQPDVILKGSQNAVVTLLSGATPALFQSMSDLISTDKAAEFSEAFKQQMPINGLRSALQSMPLQDTIDLAVFLVSVQIEMERFTPGVKQCGGPIDVMILQTAPKPAILSYPGKLLHHPDDRSRPWYNGQSC